MCFDRFLQRGREILKSGVGVDGIQIAQQDVRHPLRCVPERHDRVDHRSGDYIVHNICCCSGHRLSLSSSLRQKVEVRAVIATHSRSAMTFPGLGRAIGKQPECVQVSGDVLLSSEETAVTI